MSKNPRAIKTSTSPWYTLWIQAIKEFFYPPTDMKKRARYAQFKNAGLFVVSTALFIFFEDKIMKLVSLESNEISRGRFGGPSPF